MIIIVRVDGSRNKQIKRPSAEDRSPSMAFGSYIRKKREDAGLPLRILAQKIDISPAYWSRIEREMEKPPKDELMEKAAAVLGLDLDEVFVEARRLPPDMQKDVAGVVRAYRKLQKQED
jgi:transcriptional regulator with XRE-family HTH domain